MLSLCDATIGYGRKELYRDASMTLAPGEVKGLVAPNGYGKTTLMRVLTGDLRRLKRGSVFLSRKRLTHDFRSPDVLYVPGDASMLHADLSARDHLRMARRLWGAEADVEEVAERWGVTPFLRKRTGALSQGMKQQVTLAVASMCAPRYLLLDEPMNALDPFNVRRASEEFTALAAQGTGILISSHILGSVATLCEEALFIRDGTLVQARIAGSLDELFDSFYLAGRA